MEITWFAAPCPDQRKGSQRTSHNLKKRHRAQVSTGLRPTARAEPVTCQLRTSFSGGMSRCFPELQQNVSDILSTRDSPWIGSCRKNSRLSQQCFVSLSSFVHRMSTCGSFSGKHPINFETPRSLSQNRSAAGRVCHELLPKMLSVDRRAILYCGYHECRCTGSNYFKSI